MDAGTDSIQVARQSARKNGDQIFIRLLSRVRIDSFFLHAIAFELLRFCRNHSAWAKWLWPLDSRRNQNTDSGWQIQGPLMDQLVDGDVDANTGLTDDAPFATGTSKQLNDLLNENRLGNFHRGDFSDLSKRQLVS